MRKPSVMTAPVAEMVTLIRANTRASPVPLVPELTMHVASAITPLWSATEATFAQNVMAPPFWAFAWPGGQALARFVLDGHAKVKGRRVLDFAAGGGLIALAAARAGAARVVAAEIDPIAEVAIALNGRLNRLQIETSHQDIVGQALSDVDFVLAGDVFYERPLTSHILPWLRHLAATGKTVLIGDPGRAYLPSDGIEPLATYVVPTDIELEDKSSKETTVWKLLPR